MMALAGDRYQIGRFEVRFEPLVGVASDWSFRRDDDAQPTPCGSLADCLREIADRIEDEGEQA